MLEQSLAIQIVKQVLAVDIASQIRLDCGFFPRANKVTIINLLTTLYEIKVFYSILMQTQL